MPPQLDIVSANLAGRRDGCRLFSSFIALSPISERRVAALFEVSSVAEMAVEVEVIVDDNLKGDDSRIAAGLWKLHGSLPSSERLKRVLSPVVQPS